MKVIQERGTGRALIVLYEFGKYADFARAVFEVLSSRNRCLLIETDAIGEMNWAPLTEELTALMKASGVRQASCISFGAAGAVIQNLCLQDLKLCRTVILVDAATRPHPSLFTRLVDRIEHSLPLGLPLRSHGQGFDSKAFLQRIRCPILVVVSSKAGSYEQSQAQLMADSLPSAWKVTLSSASQPQELASLVNEFQDVPAKCPQKNVA